MMHNPEIIFRQSTFLSAYSYDDVNEFVSKPHGRLLDGPEGHALYKQTTDEVLEISATLDDTKKVIQITFNIMLIVLNCFYFVVKVTRVI